MKKYFLIIAALCGYFLGFSQLTIKVVSLPANTDPNTVLFIAGNFNGWNPGDSAYILNRQNDGSYKIVINPPVGLVEFKFTRGTWASNEGDAQGGQQANHQFEYAAKADSVNVAILSWQGASAPQHTATANVHIIEENYYVPQLNRSRRIWLYLPPGYDSLKTKRFPVMYMHDGQNLFDKATAFSGEWMVDETLNGLFAKGDPGCIVVGIDNGGASRLNEYSPWVNAKYGGGEGSQYVDFLVNTLKPHIDSFYRTKTDRDNTAISGSSMGGLISLYAILKYPNVYSKAGVFSPSLWFSDQSFAQAGQFVKKYSMKIYLVAGQNEENLSGGTDSNAVNLVKMAAILKEKGFGANEVNLQIKADGQHAEWFWAREFPAAYQWLFGSLTGLQEQNAPQKVRLYPNPSDSMVYIDAPGIGDFLNIRIYDLYGRLMTTQPLRENHAVDVHYLKPGIYLIEGARGSSRLFTEKIQVGR